MHKVKVLRHARKKPEVRDDILNHFNIDSSREHCVAIIGDRILTDIVMGNAFGYLTIYTKPIDTSKENFMVTIARAIEDRILTRITPSDCRGHKLLEGIDKRDLVREERKSNE